MTIVTTSEAQAMLPRLLASVALGEDVLITEGGLPVARLVLPGGLEAASPAASTQPLVPEAEGGEDDRPWRGVFAIESRGDPYPCGKLRLPAEPLAPAQEPGDIFWDRLAASDD